MTQFGRALAELNIEIIYANSSQAKGRVERVNRTLQDRLVKEQRLDGVCDMGTGNAFLPEFLERFNEKFADGRLEVRWKGQVLPYRIFDKDQRVSHTAIIENKRLGHALAIIRAQQDLKYVPKVKTNSEKIGYQKRERKSETVEMTDISTLQRLGHLNGSSVHLVKSYAGFSIAWSYLLFRPFGAL
jgi:hypothetical protein